LGRISSTFPRPVIHLGCKGSGIPEAGTENGSSNSAAVAAVAAAGKEKLSLPQTYIKTVCSQKLKIVFFIF
jgi:hypothetical protein